MFSNYSLPHLFADMSNDLQTPQKVNFVSITMSGEFQVTDLNYEVLL